MTPEEKNTFNQQSDAVKMALLQKRTNEIKTIVNTLSDNASVTDDELKAMQENPDNVVTSSLGGDLLNTKSTGNDETTKGQTIQEVKNTKKVAPKIVVDADKIVPTNIDNRDKTVDDVKTVMNAVNTLFKSKADYNKTIKTVRNTLSYKRAIASVPDLDENINKLS